MCVCAYTYSHVTVSEQESWNYFIAQYKIIRITIISHVKEFIHNKTIVFKRI